MRIKNVRNAKTKTKTKPIHRLAKGGGNEKKTDTDTDTDSESAKSKSETTPAARSYWRGTITFGLINIPVRLVPGFRASQGLHFHLLDKKNNGRIGYKRVNKSTGQEVPMDRIVKAYQFTPHEFVVVTDEDLERANPKSMRSIEIHDFIDLDDLDVTFFQRPYFVWPDKNGEKGYALLHQSLKDSGKVAVAEIILSQKQHLCALLPRENYFVLELLYYDHELTRPNTREIDEKLSGVKLAPREVQMANALIEGMIGEWNPQKYHDTYYEDVMRRIQSKIRRGKTAFVEGPEREAPRPTTNIVDLMPLLEKSLRAARKAKTRQKVSNAANPTDIKGKRG